MGNRVAARPRQDHFSVRLARAIRCHPLASLTTRLFGIVRGSVLLGGLACAATACATIPKHEYGVRSLSVEGMKQLDEEALKVCLATQARERTGFMLGVAGEPECGVAPFDAARVPVALWSWPWTDWPLYDETVWNRDVARVARWYRARGYYAARVTKSTQTPDPEERTLELGLTVEEGQPVLVKRIVIAGIEATDARTRAALHAALKLRVGGHFDETFYDDSKRALTDVLREHAYALASVEGEIRIDPPQRAAEVTFRIAPGRRFRFGKISVTGQGDLPVRPVLGAAEIDEGEPFKVSVLEDAKRAIYELGPFASVEMIEKPREQEGRVDLIIKLVPGRLLRTAIGAGLQVGTDPTLTPTDAPGDALDRWDLHLLGRIEYRNFLGGMRRISIEDRPRVVFNDPFPTAVDPDIGNLLILDFRQPAFLEPRTTFAITGRWDRGRDPYTDVLRSDLLGGAGPERSFFDGKLRASINLNVNWFLPSRSDRSSSVSEDGTQTPAPRDVRADYPAYYATYMQYALALDLRDVPREPTRGAYFALTVQHGGYFLPSDWDYVRVTPDVRAYLPLGLGLVLAGRARIGIMEIGDSRIAVREDPYGVEQRLRDLGPLRQRLRGGGNNSVRGYRPNTLGDVTEINEVIDSGGLRQWEASIELRATITSSFGAVLFLDAGDVSRAKSFRLRAPQTSVGFGLRYRTIIGPIRLDAGYAIPGLQWFGRDPRIREAYDNNGATTRFNEASFLGTPFAVHFTIGEAY